MKIAIVGCGALGSYYGARLCWAGHQTYFLLRSDLELVRERGVRVLGSPTPESEFHVNPICARVPGEIGPCELVLIGLKTTANHVFPELLPPLVDRQTAVLTLQNGLGNEAALAQLFPVGQILGGLAYVSLNRTAPGVIRCHDPGTVVLGEWAGAAIERTAQLAQTFKAAGVVTTVCASVPRERWKKLVWNIPFNGLCTIGAYGIDRLLGLGGTRELGKPVGSVISTDQILHRPRWRAVADELLREIIRTAQALGHDLPDQLADSELARTEGLGAYKPSTAIDFELGRPLELEAIFLEPLRHAQRMGVKVPRFTALCAELQMLSAPAV